MKTFSSNMDAQLASSSSTLTACVTITRTDGTVYRFTAYDKDLTIGGNLYQATSSYEATTINVNTKLSSDNFDINGIVSALEIKEGDLLKGLYDNAEVQFFLVDYTNPDDYQHYLTTGYIGELTHNMYSFTAEFRSLVSKLTQKIVDLYSRSCRAQLGDSRCGINLEPSLWAASTTYGLGDQVRPSTYSGFSYVCTSSGDSGLTEPSWNEVLDGTTSDNEVTWTAQYTKVKELSPFPTSLPIKKFRVTFTAFNSTFLNLTNFAMLNTAGENVLNVGNYISTLTYDGGWSDCTNNAGDCRAEVFEYDQDSLTGISRGHGGQNIILDYEFENITNVYNYTMTGSDINNAYPTAWTLEVSHDGITYYTVDTRTGEQPSDVSEMPNHIIYEIQNKGNFVATGLSTNSKTVVYIPESDPHPDDWYKYGKIEWLTGNNAGTINDIVAYDSTTKQLTLFLNTPFEIEYDDTFKLTAGCNKLLVESYDNEGNITYGHCKTKFNNVINFRGEPYLPTEDKLTNTDY